MDISDGLHSDDIVGQGTPDLPSNDEEDESFIYNPYDDDDDDDDEDDEDDGDEDYEDAPEEQDEEYEEVGQGGDGGNGLDHENGELHIVFRGGANVGDGDIDDMIVNRRIIGILRTNAGSRVLTPQELLTLIQTQDMGNVLNAGHDDEDLQDDFRGWPARRPRRTLDPNRFPKVPSEEGSKLMHSGQFGANVFAGETKVQKSLAMRLLRRELGLGDEEERRRIRYLIPQGMVPSTKAEMIIQYDACVFSGQFSNDGNFYFACGQDFRVRMYDTSNPHDWKHYKTVEYPDGRWTLTDGSLSPDNRWLAYTSISSEVCLAPTNPDDRGDPYTMDLGGGPRGGGRRRGGFPPHDGFGIWSIRFSGDGRQLVAGTNADCVVVYDIESRTVLNAVRGHRDDVNAVCFADSASPWVFYSGSDDSMVKVWDRRDLRDSREAGAFVGHIEGITYIDSKNDGRYILSNGKDQSMKLWDCRKMMSSARFRELDITREATFDYRWGSFRESDWHQDPNDNSVVTFRGHKVLRTLIRCHFSPPNSTNSRYVYSGSQDGKVYIWNMDATLRETVDVREATMGTRPNVRRPRVNIWVTDEDADPHETCVRDASWHPNAPMIVATAFNGLSRDCGTCSVHRFNDDMEDEAISKEEDEDDDMLQWNGISYDEFMKPFVANRRRRPWR